MRLASWILVACCALAALGLCFPAIEAKPALVAHVGVKLQQKANISLVQAASDRKLARRWLAAFRASHGQHVGRLLLAQMEPHAHGAIKDALDSARDALDTIGGISDDDARTIGTAVAIAIWTFLGLQILIALLVLGQAIDNRFRRGRIITVLALATLGALVAVAMGFACKEAAFQINDDLGYAVAEAGAGAWLIPIGGVGALAAAIALLVGHVRAARR